MRASDTGYASFWQRLGALCIDAIVLTPFGLALVFLPWSARPAVIAVFVAHAALYPGYAICAHARSGQTVGKWLMGARVVRVSGQRIGWREAWLRSVPDVAFAALGLIGRIAALTAMTEEITAYDFLAASATDPTRADWADWAGALWTLSEVLVMLSNEERRAMHDFIAGTIVVRVPKAR